ncbi:NADH-quinone oxidoreductase subunit NuoG [Ferrimicrobium acidiphilum]|uniref:NADH-quinone oxidoreductase subunit NuoG n=1 Tax=Ferrimicrobium acidiphilum TaxID=121039 RepID=UPI0023F00036|nr:NADH-quinone oxidoreductase subunit NuoG [Ferrimicrobium acidiphilum]
MPDELVAVTFDGQPLQARKGVKLIDALDEAGIHVPRFCYHPRMSAVGMCRMCLVEVKGPRGVSLQPSCYLDVADGMEVFTESDAVKKAQHGVLEFLLANHPLDCPVCDKGGECPLQDQAFAHGSGETRFVEEKRHYAKPIPISRLIKLDRERCIQCDRCTRFADEVAGEPLIDFAGRGGTLRISTFSNVDFDSYFSGNVAQICPVGALTTTPYRFKARPWDLIQSASTCTQCDMGCQVSLQSSQNELTRMLGIDSDAINHSWLCDRGRFSTSEVNNVEHRVTRPRLKDQDGPVEVSWTKALRAAASTMKRAIDERGASAVAVLSSASLTLEDTYAWAKLASDVVRTNAVDGAADVRIDGSLLLGNPASINEALAARRLVLFNVDPKNELPVLHLRLRAAIRAGLRVVEVNAVPTDLTPIVDRWVPIDPANLATTIDSVVAALDGDLDDVVVMAGCRDRALGTSLNTTLLGELLSRIPRAKVLSGIAHGASALAVGFTPSAPRGIRSSGGVEPSMSADSIVAAALRGEVAVLVVLDSDLMGLGLTEDELLSLSERTTVIALSSFESATTNHAAIVLPMSAYGEQQGSTLNIEWRHLRLGRQVEPVGQARSAWMIAAELASMLGDELGFLTLADITRELAQSGGLLSGLGSHYFSDGLDGPLFPLSRREERRTQRVLDPMATPGVASIERQGANFAAGNVIEPSESPGFALGIGEAPKSLPSVRSSVTAGVMELEPLTEGEYWLSLVPRLYDPSPGLLANPFLKQAIREPVLAVAPTLAKELGLADGDHCRLVGAGSTEMVVRHAKDQSLFLAVQGVTPATQQLLGDQSWVKVRVEKSNG